MANAKAFFETKSDVTGEAEASTVDGKLASPKHAAAVATGGVPVKLWKTIMEEVYQRSVGPDVDDTKKYKSFSSETYGELNPMYAITCVFHGCDHTEMLNLVALDSCRILFIDSDWDLEKHSSI